jgi:hypothetical protein
MTKSLEIGVFQCCPRATLYYDDTSSDEALMPMNRIEKGALSVTHKGKIREGKIKITSRY